MRQIKYFFIYITLLLPLSISKAFGDSIKVGVLHSLSGTMAISEKSVVDAVLLAIDEINTSGGINGKTVIPIIRDGASDWPTFAAQAEDLITKEEVKVIFGCWTSASRKTVKPVLEKYDHLMFYPVQYEGLEQSPNIVYTGAAPNQQLLPAADWAMKNIGKKIFLVGSDYVFPQSANAILIDAIKKQGGSVVGEEYVPLGSHNVNDMINKIKKTKPDVILNSINGDTNVTFFNQLDQAGLNADKLPVISFSISEPELQVMGATKVKGHYAAWNYFQSIDRRENKKFVASIQSRIGSNYTVSDPMAAGYLGVYLWQAAVEAAGSVEPKEVRKALGNVSYNAPQGLVSIDQATQHTKKKVYIGQIRGDGQFDIVWESKGLVDPIPYPDSRTKAEWEAYLQNLYNDWDQNWANPNE